MTTAPQGQSSSNKTTIIVIIVCLALIAIVGACGGLGWYFAKNFITLMTAMVDDMQRSIAASNSFLTDVSAGRLDAAYDQTSEDFRKKMSMKQFQDFVAKHKGLTNGTLSMTNSQPPANDMAQIQFSMTGPGGPISGTVMLVKEDGEWKVDQFTIP